MLQNPCKTLGFKKNMVYKIPPGGGGKPYPASGLLMKYIRKSAPSFRVFTVHSRDTDMQANNNMFVIP